MIQLGSKWGGGIIRRVGLDRATFQCRVQVPPSNQLSPTGPKPQGYTPKQSPNAVIQSEKNVRTINGRKLTIIEVNSD